VRLETDTDLPLRARMTWGEAFGAVLAGGALALGPAFGRVLFGATVDDDNPRARGSHPDLDRLWSTEGTSFRQDGTELGKMGRIELVSRDPVALRHLKVCWEVDTSGNCGRCFKCVKTMTALARSGDTGWAQAFDVALTPSVVRDCEASPAEAARIRHQLLGNLPPELAPLESAWARKARSLEREEARRARRRLVRRRARRFARSLRRAQRRRRRVWRRGRRRLARAVRLRRWPPPRERGES
jgi:hypothetical protein